jgi:hypothetical protein
VQVRQHGEGAAVVVLCRGETELVEDRARARLHGSLSDGEPLADRLVRAALGDQLEHGALTWRQRSEWRPLLRIGQQPGDDLRIERGAAAGHAPQRGGELGGLGHAVLEQIAEVLRLDPGRVVDRIVRGDAGFPARRRSRPLDGPSLVNVRDYNDSQVGRLSDAAGSFCSSLPE